jgi:hypothetical protein
MMVSALFAVEASDFESARIIVEKTLGISFEERESSARGGVYFRFRGDALQELVLQENIEVPENEPAEEDFPQSSYLLYISGVPEDSEFLSALKKAPEKFPNLRIRRR